MFGMITEDIMVSGKTIICMDWVYIILQMEINLKDNSSKLRSKAMAYIIGRTVESILDGGIMGNSMVLAYLQILQNKL